MLIFFFWINSKQNSINFPGFLNDCVFILLFMMINQFLIDLNQTINFGYRPCCCNLNNISFKPSCHVRFTHVLGFRRTYFVFLYTTNKLKIIAMQKTIVQTVSVNSPLIKNMNSISNVWGCRANWFKTFIVQWELSILLLHLKYVFTGITLLCILICICPNLHHYDKHRKESPLRK